MPMFSGVSNIVGHSRAQCHFGRPFVLLSGVMTDCQLARVGQSRAGGRAWLWDRHVSRARCAVTFPSARAGFGRRRRPGRGGGGAHGLPTWGESAGGLPRPGREPSRRAGLPGMARAVGVGRPDGCPPGPLGGTPTLGHGDPMAPIRPLGAIVLGGSTNRGLLGGMNPDRWAGIGFMNATPARARSAVTFPPSRSGFGRRRRSGRGAGGAHGRPALGESAGGLPRPGRAPSHRAGASGLWGEPLG